MAIKILKRIENKQPTPEQLEALKRISIAHGPHDAPAERPSTAFDLKRGTIDKGLCVMEAVSFITGQQHTDHPMCVSQIITEKMQAMNDEIGSTTRRNRLKELVPEVMGTRPIELVEQTHPRWKEARVYKRSVPATDPQYARLEKLRAARLEEILTAESKKRGRNEWDLRITELPLKRQIEIIRELAAIR